MRRRVPQRPTGPRARPRDAREAQTLNEQLTNALNTRIVIEQAKGMVAERAATNMDEAFSALRQYARDNNLRLLDVAQSVIDGAIPSAALGIVPPRGAI
jgi:AmiR/NasT family two-component response regulator